jgi:5-oxoprolinase (ATP-hydrolysing) subunit A
MGEGMGNENEFMPFINAANIACGYHAGDAETIKRVINLCLQNNVHVGAHPSFKDRENFGRKPMHVSPHEIYTIITEQLHLINSIALQCGATLHHIKPHGALYNLAAIDTIAAKAIAMAVKDFDKSLIYYGLSGSVMISEAYAMGLQTFNEVFADRTYQPDGTLTPRDKPNALLTSREEVLQQVHKFLYENKVACITGEEIYIKADTICIHGDGAHAIDFARSIYQKIHEQ